MSLTGVNTTIYDFKATDIIGNIFDFNSLKGKVILIVNTASKCGFTNQYVDLELLYKKYHSQGLEIVAFPCNQFANQESSDNATIQQFCSINYDVTFTLMQKIMVNGSDTHPVYQFLKKQARGIFWTQNIKWNFTKFLINRDGTKIIRYAPNVRPISFEAQIQKLL